MENEHQIKQNFGNRLRELRLKKGVSQEDLALTAGLDRTYVNSVENGKRNISLVNIIRLAKALKIAASDLFSGS